MALSDRTQHQSLRDGGNRRGSLHGARGGRSGPAWGRRRRNRRPIRGETMAPAEDTNVRGGGRPGVFGALVAAMLDGACPAAVSAQSAALPSLHRSRLSAGRELLHHDRGSRCPALRALPAQASTIAARSWASTSSTPARNSPRFVRDKRGRFTTIDVPGAQGTEPHRSNNRGQIVGFYSDDTPIVNNSARPRGFLLDRGELTAIDCPWRRADVSQRHQRPRSSGGRVHSTPAAWSTASCGTRVGSRPSTGRTAPGHPLPTSTTGPDLGCLPRSHDPGTTSTALCCSGEVYTTFDAPGARSPVPLGINNRGQIVGYSASDPAFITLRGFLLRRGVKGPFTPIDFPGAPRYPGGRHQRPRADRRCLREPRCRAGCASRARCGCR